jgi:hypothetical protein
MTNTPIFVVGVQRSGTTLLAAMLAAHSRLSCGPETHFFRRLAGRDARELCDRSTWPGRAAEFVWSIDHTGVEPGTRKTLLEKYRLSRDQIPAFLDARPASISSVLASVTEPYMLARGKVRWVEKTPDHLSHVVSIRRYFPDAPVVRIVRDPRDVALSLMRVPWGVRSVIEGVRYWERLDGESREFFESDRTSFTLRFEDLVTRPAEQLRTLCDFLGEPFETGMLDTSSTGVDLNSRKAPWKDKVRQAADRGRVAVWRAELTDRENRVAEALVGDRLDAFGYPRVAEFHRAGEFLVGHELCARFPEAMSQLASEGIRFWRTSATERAAVQVILGDPTHRSSCGAPSHDRGPDGRRLLARIVRTTLSGGELRWFPERRDGAWAGWKAFLYGLLLAPFRAGAAHDRPRRSLDATSHAVDQSH